MEKTKKQKANEWWGKHGGFVKELIFVEACGLAAYAWGWYWRGKCERYALRKSLDEIAKNTTYLPKENNFKIGDLGKLGEHIFDNMSDLTAETPVEAWRITYK